MNNSKNIKVDRFLIDLQSLSPKNFELVNVIRSMFFTTDENTSEEFKYGGIIFERSNTLVAGVFCYKKHISIEFSQGAQFQDSNNILEGQGKYRRHIKLHSKEDISLKKYRFILLKSIAIFLKSKVVELHDF